MSFSVSVMIGKAFIALQEADIGFILNFSKYSGRKRRVSKIETTYRFSQKLIEISGGFIMQNPVQIKKSIRGKSEDFGFPLGENLRLHRQICD